VETQRQWSDLAILRTTPALLGLFSLVAVWADELARAPVGAVRPRIAGWYDKRKPTFSDAIAAVRRALWSPPGLSMSRPNTGTVEISAALLQRLTDTLCYAASNPESRSDGIATLAEHGCAQRTSEQLHGLTF